MKKLITICLFGYLTTSGVLFAQENTLNEFGNVGIGTTTPTEKLQVMGTVRFDSTLVVMDSVTLEKDVRIKEKLVVDQKVVMKNDAVVKQDLKVEGKSNFDSTAVFNGNVKYTNLESVNNLNNQEFLIKGDNGQVKSVSLPKLADAMYSKVCPTDPNEDVLTPTWQNGLNKIYYDCPKVNVGIGTDNPRVKLDVAGITHTNRLAINTNPTTMTGWFHMKTNITSQDIQTIFVIENMNKRLFQINNDGIVRAGEVIVQLPNQWPDYVFEKAYPLLPLSELELFIQKEGHLPNVPSAESVESEGVSLGEMNRILLEKVEELTLYLLEQNKRIEELEKELKK
jgi:cytoskeletal protein CcmA (bactofilin family)